ncbi:hypothetical protein RUND412_008518 [Rhizina undulata]
MALPSPTQSSGLNQPLPQWQGGSEESLRTWLQAKMEEDRRRAEEERTRQESLKLDLRKTELEFLKECLKGGVPPPLVPVMFVGAGALLKTPTGEWVNEYIAQNMTHLQQQQQQLQQAPHQSHYQLQQGQHSPSAPGLRRETRLIGQAQHQPPAPSAQPPQSQHMGPPPLPPPPPPPSTPGGPPQQQTPLHQPSPGQQPYYPPYIPPRGGMPPQQHQQQPPGPPPPPPPPTLRSAPPLPKINTNEMQRPGGPMGPTMQMQMQPHVHQMQQQPPSHPQPPSGKNEAAQVSQSPSIYFHHWQPPASSTPVQATSSPQRQLDPPPIATNPTPTSRRVTTLFADISHLFLLKYTEAEGTLAKSK